MWTTQGAEYCFEQIQANSCICMAIYLPSHKPYKKGKPDIGNITGEVMMNLRFFKTKVSLFNAVLWLLHLSFHCNNFGIMVKIAIIITNY